MSGHDKTAAVAAQLLKPLLLASNHPIPGQSYANCWPWQYQLHDQSNDKPQTNKQRCN
jgi:hypothetical protein